MNAVTPTEIEEELRRKMAEAQAAGADGLRIKLDEQQEAAAASDAASAQTETSSAAKSAAAAQGSAQARPAAASAVRPEARRRTSSAAMTSVPAQLAGVEVTLSVEVGARQLALRELLNAQPGELYALDRMTDEPVTVLVNGHPFAEGEIVSLGDRFGVRLLAILPGEAE